MLNATNFKNLPYFAAFFFVGAYSIVTQVLLIREFLVIFFGNELCMGIIFSVWLFAIFAGAVLGGRVVSRTLRVLPGFILFQYILLVLPFIQIFLIRNLRLLLHIPSGEYVPFLPMTASILWVLFLFTFFIGFIFPFAIRISPHDSKSPAQGIGTVYIWESVGSAVAGAALTFYGILHYSPYQIFAILVVLVFLNTLLLMRDIREQWCRILFIVLWLSLMVVWGGLTYFRGWNWIEKVTIQQRWQTINPHLELIESLNSPYENIVVARMAAQYSIYGNGQHVASFPDPFQSAMKAHFILSQHPDPEKVLLIGGGISELITEILKHPVKTLHYVELDANLLHVARKYLYEQNIKPYDDSRVQVFSQDGRYYVKRCKEKYDLVIINLPDPSTAMLNRFYTLDFFHEISTILRPNGLLVTGVSSSENYIGPEIGNYAASIYHSLTKVFPHVLVTPGDYNYFFACHTPGVATANIQILAQRYAARDIDTPYFSPYHFQLFLPQERVAFINKIIKDFRSSRLNTDARPASYFYNLILWDIFSGGKGRRFFQLMETLSWTWYFSPLVLILILRFLYLGMKKTRTTPEEVKFNCLFAIFAAGFAGMGLEIILIFAYQNMFGYLYQRIGIIVSLFMAGLAIGAHMMNRSMGQTSHNWLKLLLGIETTITVYSLSLPFILASLFQLQGKGGVVISELLFMLLVFVSGGLTGVEFPLVNGMLIREGGSSGRVAGLVDGFDHLGASMGAALIGTLFIPLLGTTQSSLFIAGLNGISCFFLGYFLIRKTRRAVLLV
ncbi:MAG: fused MFS/spermidine synthase [Pseudomonadota bacterium]